MSTSIEWRTPGEEWKFAAGFSSIDAAKSSCRNMRKPSAGGRSYRAMDFRIYHNNKLVFVSQQGAGWRMRWAPGNGLSREEQE